MRAFKKEIIVDKEEYIKIVDRYIDMVYRIALSGCKNTFDADDVVQNTFMKLLKYKKSLESDVHIKNWLIKVAVNECNSIWSSSWRKRNIALSEDFDGIYNEPVFTDTGQSRMYESLMELNQKYRQPLYLYYQGDCKSIKDIGDFCYDKASKRTSENKRKNGRTKK